MRALHTTLTRPVHYPQDPVVLDYADRHDDEKGNSLGGGERRFAQLNDAVGATGTLRPGTLQPGEGHALRLNVELKSPTGLSVANEVLEWPPRSVAQQ